MLDQLVEGVCEEPVTEPRDAGGPFQSYVPGNGHGSLPGAISTDVFMFLAAVCEAASLEPKSFIPGSRTGDSHADLKNAHKDREGNDGSEGCRQCHCAIWWGETQLTPLCPSPWWVFCSLTPEALSAC